VRDSFVRRLRRFYYGVCTVLLSHFVLEDYRVIIIIVKGHGALPPVLLFPFYRTPTPVMYTRYCQYNTPPPPPVVDKFRREQLRASKVVDFVEPVSRDRAVLNNIISGDFFVNATIYLTRLAHARVTVRLLVTFQRIIRPYSDVRPSAAPRSPSSFG